MGDNTWLFFRMLVVAGHGCILLVRGLPVEDTFVKDTEEGLPVKLLSVIHTLAERRDSNILDFVLETNADLGLNLFEGDIQGFNPRHRAAIQNPTALWTTRIVPYVIDPSVEPEVRTYIQEAIAEYHSKTCITWVARTNEKDYVVFKKKTGCYSMVGKSTAGPQELSLMRPCAKKGTVMHEMLHVLGFFHEHSRPDRDQWVEILLQNVRVGKERNFDRLPVDLVDTLGVQYDYESIMHYSRTAFTFNGQPTILPKTDPFANLGQRDGFSPRDIQKINKLYRCDLTIPDVITMPSQPTDVPVTNPSVVVTRPPIGWTGWSAWSDCGMQCRHFRYRYCLNPDHSFCPGDSQEFQTCPPPCQVAVSLGCWTNEPSSFAIPSVEGLDPLVKNTYRFRVAAVRRCADVATSMGHLVFALTDGGMCLTGPQAHSTFSTYGPSSTCSRNGKGSSTAMNVYSFSKDIDGDWGLWTDWGQCSRSCGAGRKYRYRKCDSPPPIGNGRPCQGHDQEIASCNTDSCQVASNCGVKYHTGTAGTSGYIQVLNYHNYMTCEYVIQSGQNDVTISLAVTRMDIEPSVGCMYDALTIYDGANDTGGQFIGAFCGNSHFPHLQSSGPALFLRFSSDSSTTRAGFTLQFAINTDTRKACTNPVKPYHGSYHGRNFVGDTIVFSCDPGNHLVGQSVIRCVDQPGMAVWSDNFPVCSRGHQKRDASTDAILRCTFDDNLCGFHHMTDDRWRWVLSKGNNSADFHLQRPKTDRLGSAESHFLYVESNSAWHSLESVRVTSQRHVINDLSPYCLRFWYRFYGNDLVYLHVLQEERGEGRGRGVLVWEAEGESHGDWEQVGLDLQPQPSVQVTFEAFLGQKLATSVAIDDVIISKGRCS